MDNEKLKKKQNQASEQSRATSSNIEQCRAKNISNVNHTLNLLLTCLKSNKSLIIVALCGLVSL